VSTLDALFFDIDDTLFSTSDFAASARRASIRAMIDAGLQAEEEQCFRELYEVIREFGPNFPKHFEKLLLRYPREKLGGVNPAIICASGVVAYHQTKDSELRPYPDVVEAFQVLNSRGLRIGIITAGLATKQAEKLVRLDLLKYIDPRAIFITDQMGIGKPNPKLYTTACHSLGLETFRCMYVGDRPVDDIDPAGSVGMVTVLNRRVSKPVSQAGSRLPDYQIYNFHDLLGILRSDFELDRDIGTED
jgi:putative hydrolase of the HAD superfamily